MPLNNTVTPPAADSLDYCCRVGFHPCGYPLEINKSAFADLVEPLVQASLIFRFQHAVEVERQLLRYFRLHLRRLTRAAAEVPAKDVMPAVANR